MDIRQVVYFCSVCDCGGYAAAARELDVSRQALQKAVRSLEGELGVVLLAKNGSRVVPTDFGTFLRRESRGVLQAWRGLESNLSLRIEHERDSVLVGVSDEIYDALEPSFVAMSTSQTSTLFDGFEPHLASNEEIIDRVRSGSLDFGCALCQARELDGLDMWLQQSHPFVLLVPERHPLAGRVSICLDDLRGERLIAGSSRSYRYKTTVEACIAKGFSPCTIASPAHTHAVVDMVASGAYCAVIYTKQSFEGVVALPFKDASMRWNAYSFRRPEMPPTYARTLYWKNVVSICDID